MFFFQREHIINVICVTSGVNGRGVCDIIERKNIQRVRVK